MVLELSEGSRHSLERDTYFSDIFAAALVRGFSGRLRFSLDTLEANLFFDQGAPSSAGGTWLLRDFLGQILVEAKQVPQEVVQNAIAEQQDQAKARPLIGSILKMKAGVTPEQVEAAMRQQIARRVASMFKMHGAQCEVDLKPYPDVRRIAVPTDGFPLLLFCMKRVAQDDELAKLSDSLLGHSVKLARPTANLEIFGPDDSDREVLAALEKPRKLHHLELAFGRRRQVRALLKVLMLTQCLELLPLAAGVPMKNAVKMGPPGGTSDLAFAPGTGTKTLDIRPSKTKSVDILPQGAEANQTSKTLDLAKRRDGPQHDVLVKELRELSERIRGQNYFQMIGVEPNASPLDIRARFTALLKKVHPDALGAGAVTEVSELARSVSAVLNEAHATLADPEKRAAYVARIREGDAMPGCDTAHGGQTHAAKMKYEMALVYLRKQNFKAAREALKMATDFAPNQGLYQGTLAWAMFADPTFDRKEALEKGVEMLKEATAQSPRAAQLHYWLGRVHKERGEHDEAFACFECALEQDPKYTEAEREIRLYGMRGVKGVTGDLHSNRRRPRTRGR